MTSAPAVPTSTRPPKLPFPLQDDEVVLRLVRRHWVYLWPRTIVMLIVALAPPIVAGLLLSKADAYEGTGAKVFWAVAGFYMLYWALRIFLNWYRYHNDIWVVTNQRIVDSLKTNPFNLRVATADLVNIQDMTVERDGILRTVLDYGDIVCETAAEQEQFRLSGIPNPRAVQLLVDRERDRERMRTRPA